MVIQGDPGVELAGTLRLADDRGCAARAGTDDEQVAGADGGRGHRADHMHVQVQMHQAHGEGLHLQPGTPAAGHEDAPRLQNVAAQIGNRFGIDAVEGRAKFLQHLREQRSVVSHGPASFPSADARLRPVVQRA